jgi:hypothetical protein
MLKWRFIFSWEGNVASRLDGASSLVKLFAHGLSAIYGDLSLMIFGRADQKQTDGR